MIERTFQLIPFEENHYFSLNGKFSIVENTLNCDLVVSPSPITSLRVPVKPDLSTKKEGLWNSTCFEIFVKSGDRYVEWNFAPSGEWWLMNFSDYRKRLASKEMESVVPYKMEWTQSENLECCASIPVESGHLQIGISCVLEVGKEKTYWALAHPKERADFHDASCFMNV